MLDSVYFKPVINKNVLNCIMTVGLLQLDVLPFAKMDNRNIVFYQGDVLTRVLSTNRILTGVKLSG